MPIRKFELRENVVDLTLSSDEEVSPDRKRRRSNNPAPNQSHYTGWRPFYLTTVEDIRHTFNESSLSFADLVGAQEDNPIQEGFLMNYMIDLEWVASEAPHLLDCHMTILHGSSVDQTFRNEKWIVGKVDMGMERFGTHHSKMALLVYQTGLRVVITTANFISDDFTYRTQGSYVQDFPFKSATHWPSSSSTRSDPTSITQFQRDLSEYLERVSISGRAQQRLQRFIERLSLFDLSAAEVVLVASIPGRHVGNQRHKWGLGKLVAELDHNGLLDEEKDKGDHLILQCSSLGSMGKEGYLLHDLASRMMRRRPSPTATKQSATSSNLSLPFSLVWPTIECVRQSLQGYASGGSLPCNSKTICTEDGSLLPGFQNHLCRWDGSPTGRARATPHMKCYFRYRPLGSAQQLSWFLLTSSNVSQAAFGVFQTNDSQLYIKSYELGVLFLPNRLRTVGREFSCTPAHRLLGCSPVLRDKDSLFVVDREVSSVVDTLSSDQLRIPFDVPFRLPAEPYRAADEPWVWDRALPLPDCLGQCRAV